MSKLSKMLLTLLLVSHGGTAMAQPSSTPSPSVEQSTTFAGPIAEACLKVLGERPLGLEKVEVDGLKVLCVRGAVGLHNLEIKSEDLVEAARTHRGRLDGLFLTSPGGHGDPWLEFAETVGQVNFVIVGGICASACATYGFVLGDKKIVLPGSFVGWHGGPTTSRASFGRFATSRARLKAGQPTIIGDIVGRRPGNPIWRLVYDRNTKARYFKLGERTERLYTRLGISHKILEHSNGARPPATAIEALHRKYRPEQILWLLLFPPEVLERCYGFKGLEHMWHPGSAEETLAFGQRPLKPFGFVTLPADLDANGCPAEPRELQ